MRIKLPQDMTRWELRRFLDKVDPPNMDGCKLWTGAEISGGYGQFKLRGRSVLAHRVAWTHENGPIPDDRDLDHNFARGCRSKLCVNTAHLELVTPAENQRRRVVARRWRASIQVWTELDEG
ncbi:HNH endonuclease signature motif containing protein [Streptomyces galilaeus]|uniref:HNH endonuclease signature motif containing protein n=1 Tax=Streptomyces galilaeus TaxID=33899 RepID=UPI0038F69B32